MSTQTLAVVLNVPDDQQTAAQAAAASFVADLPGNVDGASVLSATFGGVSLLPSPRERLDAARATFDTLAGQSSIKPAELKAALADLDAATAAYEASLTAPAIPTIPLGPDASATPAGPVVSAVPEVTVNPETEAATQAAPTGEEDQVVPQAGQPAVPAS